MVKESRKTLVNREFVWLSSMCHTGVDEKDLMCIADALVDSQKKYSEEDLIREVISERNQSRVANRLSLVALEKDLINVILHKYPNPIVVSDIVSIFKKYKGVR